MPVDRSLLTTAHCCANCKHSKCIYDDNILDIYYCTFFDGGKLIKTEINEVTAYQVCPFFEK